MPGVGVRVKQSDAAALRRRILATPATFASRPISGVRAPRLQAWALLTTTGGEIIDHRSATEGIEYAYKVRAVRNGDHIAPGAFSDPAVGYVLSRPSDLRAGQGTHVDRIPLTWAGMGGAQYEIWREGDVGYVLIGTSGTRYYQDTDVTPGEGHRYKVRARNAAGVTGYSNIAEGYAAAAWVDLAVRQPVVLPKIVCATALRTSSETGVGAPRLQALLEGRPSAALRALSKQARRNGYAPRTEIAAHSAPPTRNPDVSRSSLANPSVSRVVSLRLYHNGGAPLTGDNGTIAVSYLGSNRTTQVVHPLGTITTRVDLAVGQSTVLTLPGSGVQWPAELGVYDVSVEIMPAWPSLLAESNPADNTADVLGAIRVIDEHMGTGYWGFNDFSGDGVSDLVMCVGGLWYARTVDGRVLGWAVPFPPDAPGGYRTVYGLDFDGDNRAEPVVYFASSGRWQGMLSGSGYRQGFLDLGGPSLMPVPGDYTGNGRANAAVYDITDGRWFVMDDAFQPLIWGEVFGAAGAVPVGGDYTGDGRWDLTVYHEPTGKWYSRTIAGELTMWEKRWGGPGYVPVMGDYDGDGIHDLALYHAATGMWNIRATDGEIIAQRYYWGNPDLIPVPGDYDGDGAWDLALYNINTGAWHIRSLQRGMILRNAHWGLHGWLPVQ